MYITPLDHKLLKLNCHFTINQNMTNILHIQVANVTNRCVNVNFFRVQIQMSRKSIYKTPPIKYVNFLYRRNMFHLVRSAPSSKEKLFFVLRHCELIITNYILNLSICNYLYLYLYHHIIFLYLYLCIL